MKTVTYEIVTDEYPSNPRDEFDHLSTFYGANLRYEIGGKQDINEYYRDDLDEKIKALRKDKAIVVKFETENSGTCYAVVERDQLQDEYIKFGQTMRQALYHARQCAKGEISEWLAYASGEVYGYIVKDDEGNELDSCWGFYGYKYCEEEAKSIVARHEEQFAKEEQELERRIEVAASL